ncbi:MAG: hypothetical protein Q8L39_09910 [Burkholderiales bacterium]|nr:hypothetical protein [Burkholderiales bacterium]
MSKVRIEDSERTIGEATPQWINEQINRRRADGIAVCVQVIFDQKPLEFALSTPTCARGGGGGRPLNQEELKVLSLWEKLHLNTPEFTSGNLVAFLKQVT